MGGKCSTEVQKERDDFFFPSITSFILWREHHYCISIKIQARACYNCQKLCCKTCHAVQFSRSGKSVAAWNVEAQHDLFGFIYSSVLLKLGTLNLRFCSGLILLLQVSSTIRTTNTHLIKRALRKTICYLKHKISTICQQLLAMLISNSFRSCNKWKHHHITVETLQKCSIKAAWSKRV